MMPQKTLDALQIVATRLKNMDRGDFQDKLEKHRHNDFNTLFVGTEQLKNHKTTGYEKMQMVKLRPASELAREYETGTNEAVLLLKNTITKMIEDQHRAGRRYLPIENLFKGDNRGMFTVIKTWLESSGYTVSESTQHTDTYYSVSW